MHARVFNAFALAYHKRYAVSFGARIQLLGKTPSFAFSSQRAERSQWKMFACSNRPASSIHVE